MKYAIFLILVYLFFIAGCKQGTNQISNDSWSALTIESEDHTLITIYPDRDTVIVKVYNTGTIFYRPKKITIDTVKAVFIKLERDSIFSLTRAIIATPPPVIPFCTDFVGDLTLKIYYREVCTQSIDYSGVCNWNTLSDKTMALHNILKRRLKKVFLGENNIGRGHVGN